MLELLFLFYCIGAMVVLEGNPLLSTIAFFAGLFIYGLLAATAVTLNWRKGSRG